ncbi:hypothetical protein OOK27_22305 [Streptomyces canus]|uniref:hypothetical protein n=1 Tax=Streptomyces canus TaxID=58343 RepID=UPI002251180B|nr:hypothetical protein [Streptomyces canus]MCX5256831.1 hypothetical protein [Streptomyces canus]
MKTAEVSTIRPYLQARFAAVTGMSVALSGSISRGDFRSNRQGDVLSDLDLIPIVAHSADVSAARQQLEPIMQAAADHFGLTCTAAITLQENFLQVPDAAYVTSMAADPFLCDPLGLRDLPKDTRGPERRDAIPWLIQPVTYYLAKTGHANPAGNLRKAGAALERLLDHLDILGEQAAPSPSRLLPVTRNAREAARSVADGEGSRALCAQALAALVEERNLVLLPSSATYLDRAAVTDPGAETFFAVRARAFVENQGVPFEESSIVAQPTTPKEGRR